MALTELQQRWAEQALSNARNVNEYPLPVRFIAGAIAHYKQDRDEYMKTHNCADHEFTCTKSACGITPVELEHAALVGIYLPDPICPDDLWAVEMKYNSKGNRFVMGISADGKYNLYQD